MRLTPIFTDRCRKPSTSRPLSANCTWARAAFRLIGSFSSSSSQGQPVSIVWYGFEARTNRGTKIRAAVDNRRMAQSIGINVDRLFTLTFAVGGGLAALGGGLAIQLLGLTQTFRRYLSGVFSAGRRCRRLRQHVGNARRRARAGDLRHRRQVFFLPTPEVLPFTPWPC